MGIKTEDIIRKISASVSMRISFNKLNIRTCTATEYPTLLIYILKSFAYFVRIGTIYEDVTTDVLGSVGVWQWLVVVVSSMLTLPSLFNGYEDMLLLMPSGEVTCIPPERYEVFNSSSCTVTSITNSTDQTKCNIWQVKLFWMIWLKKSWFVFCEDKIRLLSTTMIYRMGLMFGCVIFGLIADSVGRRIAVIVELFAQLVLGAIITFCDSLAWFQLLVFLKSLFGGAKIFMGVIIACEVASNKWRSSFNSIVSAPRLLAIVCMVPVANAVPNLETLSTLDTLFCSFLVVILRWIPESPQWLLFNRKIYVAEKLLYHAAEKNGRKLWSQFKIRPVNHRAYNSLDERRTCAEILTTYNIRMIILVALLMWCLFWYQWSYLYVKVYSGNAKQLLSTLLCFIALFCVVTFILSKKLILRHLLLINLLFFGIFSSSEIAFGHVVPNLFSYVALGSGVVVHALLMNITPRLFALKIRATLVGCCHAVGQLGTMISYLFFAFQPLNNMIYVAVNTAITMALATLSLTLLDVDGRELPDMIDDMDYFSELSKPLRWATQKTNSPSKEEIEMRIYSFGSAPRASNSQEQERIPARRIGFTKFWRSISKRFRRTR